MNQLFVGIAQPGFHRFIFKIGLDCLHDHFIAADTAFFARMSSGTLNVLDGTYDVTASSSSTANGIKMTKGTANVRGGTIRMSGKNATGIEATNGTVTIGTQGGGVSKTNPYIEAIGSTSGIGLSQGQADMYFYDGKVVGSTQGRISTDILTGTEDGYELHENTDPNTGYKYCVIEEPY